MSARKALATLAAIAGLAAGSVLAQQTPPYNLISPAQPTEGGGKVEVLEFFWYGCPHCFHLEPQVNSYIKSAPPEVVFKRIPAIPSDAWGEAARIFYTLEAMGLLEKYHQKVFEAFQNEKVNLANKKLRDEWLAKNGIDVAKYAEAEKSFTVVTKLNRARQLTAAYKVDSVPRVAVNGQYAVSAETAGGQDRIFTVVGALVNQSRAAPAPAAAPAKK